MTALYLLEPNGGPAWFPYWDSRPIAELRAGAWLIRERWESISDGPASAIFGPEHLHAFSEPEVPHVGPRTPVAGPAIVGRSDFAPSGVKPDLPDHPVTFVNGDDTVGWWVPEGETWSGDESGWETAELEGFLLHGAYDVVTALEYLLPGDVADFVHGERDEIPEGSLVIGDPAEVILLGAVVEPGVTFDVRAGAVVVEQHTHVKSGTRFEGPIYVGAGSVVHGGQITNSVIGPVSRVRGEMNSTVMLGFGNKGHDGFVGHSVLGRWVNLGAGTTTSNLKNTYGEISLLAAEEKIDTGRTFLGTLFGDHVKTAIGTMLSTGTAVGVGANLFGRAGPGKTVPPFAWGYEGESMRLEGFLKTAERVFSRRKEQFTEEQIAMLTAIYNGAAV